MRAFAFNLQTCQLEHWNTFFRGIIVLKIDELLKVERIALDLTIKDKFEVIDKLAELMSGAPEVSDFKRMRSDIVQREKEMPTGLDFSAAIPHARTAGVKDLVLAFARLKNPVDFGSPDGQPAKLIFQFGVPVDQVSLYLKTLAKLSRLLKSRELREKLLKADSPQNIIDSFAGK